MPLTRSIPRLLPLAVALAVVALAASACGGSSGSSAGGETSESTTTETSSTTSEESEGGTTTIAGDEANDHGATDVSGMDEISLELDDDYFEPTLLRGSANQTLQIELENEGSDLHNFSIDRESLDQDVDADGKATVSVTFPKSGVLQFYCKYHKELGMVGGLAVGGGASSSSTTTTGETTTEDTTTDDDTTTTEDSSGGSGEDGGGD